MNKFESFRERWNSRAKSWDYDISKPDHYANFEDGYKKFLDFESRILEACGVLDSGIDLGCGTAEASNPLSERVEHLYLLDLAEQMLTEAAKKFPEAKLLHSSVTAIPLKEESIDYAVSRGVLISHLPAGEQENFLSEVNRILRPNGLFIFDFLNNLETADFHLSSEKTVYTTRGIYDLLQKHGFETLLIDGEDGSRVIRVAARKY